MKDFIMYFFNHEAFVDEFCYRPNFVRFIYYRYIANRIQFIFNYKYRIFWSLAKRCKNQTLRSLFYDWS
jgi:hypothetical protein